MPINLSGPDPAEPIEEIDGASLADVIVLVAESIAEGQARLDRSSAEVVQELAKAKVFVVPQITRTIEVDGSVKYEQAAPVELSLLDLGLLPTFYAFSEATVEVDFDVGVVEETNSSGTEKRRRLFASTRTMRWERRLKRDVKVHSKIQAKLVPVPMPALLGPARVDVDKREDGGV